MPHHTTPIHPASRTGSAFSTSDQPNSFATGPVQRPLQPSLSASLLAQQTVAQAPFVSRYWRQLAQFMLNRELNSPHAVFVRFCLDANQPIQFNTVGAATAALQMQPLDPENWETLANIVKPNEFIALSLNGEAHVYSGQSLRDMARLIRRQHP